MIAPASRTCQAWSRELLQSVGIAQCCPRGSRAISTNSAIARGLRETAAAEHRSPASRGRALFRKELEAYDDRRNEDLKQKRTEDHLAKMKVKMDTAKRRAAETMRGQAVHFSEEVLEDWDSEENNLGFGGESMDMEEAMRLEERQVHGYLEPRYDGPVSIPYTTAASKFIYGASAVRAALIAKRRECYKLYIHDRALRRASNPVESERNHTTDGAKSRGEAIKTLADLAENIPGLTVKMVDDSFLPAMDKMSDYRPHNGVILEASPLPVLPVVNLRPVQRTRPYFDIDLDKQSREEARINGTNSRLKYNSHGWRYPFILYLDGIVDEGNIGAIMRTAYYFGVDAVALSKRGTAPIDSVALKASSGAAEGLPILTVANPHTFLHRSTHNNGWRLYAADVPLPPRDNFNVTADHTYAALDPLNTSPLVSFTRPHTLATLRDHSPLLQHPAILMLGGEAAGFRHSIRAKANYLVGVRGTAGLAMGVDSLNVSVAAALIMLEMLRRPKVADVVKRRVDQNYDYGREKREKARRDANQLARKTDDSVSNDELLF